MPTPKDVKDLIEGAGGTVEEISGPLPDGSGFATASFPLPDDHWIYGKTPLNPPAPLRMGTGPLRDALAHEIREAGKYAYLAAEMSDDGHDPDAFLQNLVVGLLGYWTEHGYSNDPDIGDLPRVS